MAAHNAHSSQFPQWKRIRRRQSARLKLCLKNFLTSCKIEITVDTCYSCFQPHGVRHCERPKNWKLKQKGKQQNKIENKIMCVCVGCFFLLSCASDMNEKKNEPCKTFWYGFPFWYYIFSLKSYCVWRSLSLISSSVHFSDCMAFGRVSVITNWKDEKGW